MSVALHQYAVSPEVLRAIALGLRTSLVVPQWLAMREGDQVVLREYVHEPRSVYTGAWLLRRLTSVTSEVGLEPNYQLVCLNTAAENEWPSMALKREIERAAKLGEPSARVWQRIERSEARLIDDRAEIEWVAGYGASTRVAS